MRLRCTAFLLLLAVSLVLVADPQTLGRIRPQLHKEVQSRLVRDLAKDFTNAPLEDIQRALG